MIFRFLFFLPILLFAKPKVYDCFLFFNELDVLEIRLNELYPHVDHFVLLESTETFRGNPKPLHYAKNKERFKKFNNKITHIILDQKVRTTNPWDREAFQRNQLTRALRNCKYDDIIMISDVDEIPRASQLTLLFAPILSKQTPFTAASQNLHRFYLNRKCEESWVGTVATTYQMLFRNSPEMLRMNRTKYPLIKNCGWHFTWMGGIQKVIVKYESYSHFEQDDADHKNAEAIRENAIQNPLYPIVPIDTTYPLFVQKNQEYLKKRGLIFSDLR